MMRHIARAAFAASVLLSGVALAETPVERGSYLVNSLREIFDLPGTPIRLTLREKKNPYARKKR